MLSLPTSAGVVSLALSLAWPGSSSAQVFGAVRPGGLVVLTNIPKEMGETGLKVIVGEPPVVHGGNAAQASRLAQEAGSANDDVDSSRFAAIIADAGRKWNVRPELLRAVIAVESNFDPLAVSKRGACGLMQLMPGTAKRFAVADLFDPRANVQGGAQYLRFLLDLFGDDVELALAAYNAGEQTVIKAGYRIPTNPETKAYVPAVMARYRRLIAEL
jgi:soluble lytic murein transglycosylase-like protein